MRRTILIPLAAAWAATTDTEKLRALDPAALFDSIPDLHDWIMSRLTANANPRGI